LNQDIQDFNTRRNQYLGQLLHIHRVNQSITQHQTAATVLQTYTRRFLARRLVNRLRQQQVTQQPTPVQTPNNQNPDNNLPTMDANQFNNLMNGLANLSNAIQAQTAAPAPARELSFAKITDFFGDSQDPIGWLQDFESACQANNVADARKTTIVGAYLKGSAGTWLVNKRMTTPNWPTQWNPANAGNQVDEAASFTNSNYNLEQLRKSMSGNNN